MSTNPKFDNAIDSEVDRVLGRMAEDTPEMFTKRIKALSSVARWVLKAMVAEQLKLENEPDRAAKLKELEIRLDAA